MDDTRIHAAVDNTQAVMDGYRSVVSDYTSTVKKSVRGVCMELKEEAEINITSCEVLLVRSTALIAQDAEYHTLRAYFHASPSLWLFIVGLWKFVTKVIGIITFINKILVVITHETLAHWIGVLMPGFEEDWKNMMNKISEFSGAIGWGVDGVLHLMNAVDVSASLFGTATGKTEAWLSGEKWKRKHHQMLSFQNNLALWQSKPGEMIGKLSEMWELQNYYMGSKAIENIVTRLTTFGDKAEIALTGVGTITSELLAIQNNMPAFIANNIPSGIWDALTAADTTINDRILPALTDITDRLEELDAVLESYRIKAAELADRLSHPGDMLAEIDKLPDYARHEQLVKIDDVTSTLLRESNESDFAAMEGDLREFGIIAAALAAPPPTLSFMTLELPGRSPGVVPTPAETWLVGDF